LQPLYETAEGLETPIQLIYLLTLLGFLGVGAYLVVRQVLIRRELDEAAKALGERIRTGEATCEVRTASWLKKCVQVATCMRLGGGSGFAAVKPLVLAPGSLAVLTEACPEMCVTPSRNLCEQY
jgi:hypothetical protein